MKIVFFGTPDLAVPFLEALISEANFEVVAVVTQPDRPVGRKHDLIAPPVKQLALQKGIQILQPETLKEKREQPDADMFVVVAYGLLIPQRILDRPRLGCINVHPSLLPKYRGPSPIQSAIANGDAETGISIMLLDKGMDTGPILTQKKIVLDAEETQMTLAEKIKQAGPKFLVETIKKFTTGEIKPMAQDDTKATVTKLLTREDGKIDWSEPAEKIERKIRAYYSWPGCWTEVLRNGKTLRVKILKSTLRNNRLFFLEVQPEGRPPMAYEEFVKGYGPIKTEQERG